MKYAQFGSSRMFGNSTGTAIIISATVATAVMLLVAVVPAAFAVVKGSTDVSCTNEGGTQPGGQQDTCKGEGLTQDTCSSTTGNGKCPSGQNK